MYLDWKNGHLAEGLRHYRAGEFFAAHESWECVWLTCPEPEKTFLQGLIQVAAAFHHLQRENAVGTASLLNGALRRLDRYPDSFGGIVVDDVRHSIRLWLKALERGTASCGLSIPEIRLAPEPML